MHDELCVQFSGILEKPTKFDPHKSNKLENIKIPQITLKCFENFTTSGKEIYKCMVKISVGYQQNYHNNKTHNRK